MDESSSARSGTRRTDPELAELAEQMYFEPVRDGAQDRVNEERKTREQVAPSPTNSTFEEIFSTEFDGWCYGLQHYPGEVFPALVHRIVSELAPLFISAIRHNLVFDLVECAQKLSRAAKYLISEREVAFSILAHLPPPGEFSEDGQFTMAQVIDQAETTYGDALGRLERNWRRKRAVATPIRRAA